MTLTGQHRLLREAFDAAIARSQADDTLRRYLPAVPAGGRLVLLGAGKASARMAEVAEAHYLDAAPAPPISGVVVLPDGLDADLRHAEVLHAAHPFPDARSTAAGRRMLEAVAGLAPEDRVVMLLSGGASSLLCAPAPGLTLADKRAVTEALFAAGAPIEHLNAVRKFLSAIKGGKLARACWPAPVTTLAISDVVGDDPAVIGSAPTVPDETPVAAVRDMLSALQSELPPAVRALLDAPPAAATTPCPDLSYHLVAKPLDALAAAAEVVGQAGYDVSVLGDDIEGEAAERARDMAAMLAGAQRERRALLAGGEVTVTFGRERSGYGGPNREFALSLATAIAGKSRVAALVADTDGVDGQSGRAGPVAGAIVDGTTLERGAALGLDAADYLARHDAGSYFERLGDEILTGPTGTNVNDFRLLLVDP